MNNIDEQLVLAHFIVSDDVERSRRFYTEVLGGRVAFSGPGGLTYVALSNSWIIINVGGGPTDDKPSVSLETPRDPDRVSSFLNIRVKDIAAVYAEWSARGANFLTPPKQHQYEIRCYIRDPDGHLIEVGQTTDPDGDWTPAHWPSSTPAEESRVNAEITGESPHIDGGQSPGQLRPLPVISDKATEETVIPMRHPVRFDIRPGGVFPDHSFSDRTGTVRTRRSRS